MFVALCSLLGSASAHDTVYVVSQPTPPPVAYYAPARPQRQVVFVRQFRPQRTVMVQPARPVAYAPVYQPRPRHQQVFVVQQPRRPPPPTLAFSFSSATVSTSLAYQASPAARGKNRRHR